MANEKENVTNVAKSVLSKRVEMRRIMYEFADEKTGEPKQVECLEVSCMFAGESVRFKVQPNDSKLMRVLMRLNGYPLYTKDGVIVEEHYEADEDL